MISSANESKGILKGQYDRLLAELAKKTEQGNEQFGQGRATISENAYDRSRANLNSLASRGLAGSGLQQLGEVQERMETGQQMNDLASQYYAYLEDLDSQRTEGEAKYNEGLQSIENALQQQLAQIGLQEFQAQNEYKKIPKLFESLGIFCQAADYLFKYLLILTASSAKPTIMNTIALPTA